jgi:hypothetical protein
MPKGTKLRQFLDALDVDVLQAIHRNFASSVAPYHDDNNKDEFVKRLRRSLKRSFGNGHFSFGELVTYVRDETQRDRRQNPTIIRDALDNLVFSSHLMSKRTKGVREHWMCAEAFQALRAAFAHRTSVRIEVEKRFGSLPVDVCVTDSAPDGRRRYLYPVEVKRIGMGQNLKKLPDQLDDYRKRISPNPEKIFILAVSEKKEFPKNGSKKAKHVINGAKRRSDTEVIVKGPSCIR